MMTGGLLLAGAVAVLSLRATAMRSGPSEARAQATGLLFVLGLVVVVCGAGYCLVG
jgi:hypothetical protein